MSADFIFIYYLFESIQYLRHLLTDYHKRHELRLAHNLISHNSRLHVRMQVLCTKLIFENIKKMSEIKSKYKVNNIKYLLIAFLKNILDDLSVPLNFKKYEKKVFEKY